MVDSTSHDLRDGDNAGIAKESASTLYQKLLRFQPDARARIRNAKVLIIDEITMLTPDFFEKFDHIARAVRDRPDVPFGGIQMVLGGDFYQLPPVDTDTKKPDWWKANIVISHDLARLRHPAFTPEISAIVCSYWYVM